MTGTAAPDAAPLCVALDHAAEAAFANDSQAIGYILETLARHIDTVNLDHLHALHTMLELDGDYYARIDVPGVQVADIVDPAVRVLLAVDELLCDFGGARGEDGLEAVRACTMIDLREATDRLAANVANVSKDLDDAIAERARS
jgi:hypothetical protein